MEYMKIERVVPSKGRQGRQVLLDFFGQAKRQNGGQRITHSFPGAFLSGGKRQIGVSLF